VEQVRVLEPGRWATYRQNEKKDWVLFNEGTTSLNSIPFVPVGGVRLHLSSKYRINAKSDVPKVMIYYEIVIYGLRKSQKCGQK
jgi:hypothetical protein